MAFSCQELPHNTYNERPVKFLHKLFARCFTEDNSQLDWKSSEPRAREEFRKHLRVNICPKEFPLQVVIP